MMSPETRKTYLLIPVPPTPNGPLHLGHIAGPCLKMDVLARHLRRNGETVALVSITDAHETHVVLKAKEQGKPVEQICAENHQLIQEGLAAFDIRYDAFINLLDPAVSSRFTAINHELLTDLDDQGLLQLEAETIHISQETQKIIVGSELAGQCPWCGAAMGGYHCEICGMEVSPGELIKPRAELLNTPLDVIMGTSVFMRADARDIERYLLEARVPANMRRIARRFINRSQGRVRMSNPGEWGENWPLPGPTGPAVVFSYTSPALFFLCGEVAQARLGLERNPMDLRSDTVTVTSFGFDNTVTLGVSVATVTGRSRRYRRFDRYLTNFFYTLEGQKFSTSRNHSIWAHEALAQLGCSSDMLRYYLARTSPETAPTDFSRQEFELFRQTVEPRLQRMLDLAGRGRQHEAERRRQGILKRLVDDLNTALDVDHFSLQAATRAIDAWLALAWQEQQDDEYIHGFCVLAYPVMPSISLTLWQALGLEGTPHHDAKRGFMEAAA